MIKKYLVNLSKKSVCLRKTFRFVLYIKNKITYLYYFLFYKIDDKMIFFESFYGNSYSCSPKAIYEYVLNDERFKDYKFVWAFKNINKYTFDERTILVKSNSRKYYKYLSKSKYWVVNLLINTGVKKKKNQVYVQCWHGTPLKKLRYDIEKDNVLNSISEVRKRNDLDAIKFDYFISPSKFCTEKFTSAFNLKKLNNENIFIEKGYPRNDYLFNYKKSDIKKIKKELNIPLNKKVILYAPTFRDNQVNENGYTYNVELDFNKLKNEFSKEYVILFRAHYFIANKFDFKKYNNFVYDVSKYEDINELYIISDILITDYSSVFFDFANLKKPILFYMYDYNNYKNNLRDFYIDLKELPGPILKKENTLIKEIKNIDNYSKKYKEKYEKFNKKYNYLDDGNATKRVVEEIFNEN
ncbi:MAG: CDP-glycerol glycerophosphotransferase family protein [Candidatus Faecisoma sp.]|nr:CDP-glycerol glycerophosphotransferase family protein [Acholeplasma sp.]MDY2893167.1 CDP-glycerol glycerophosphotransferase family protein [Candidatus Faecisoma sp.]